MGGPTYDIPADYPYMDMECLITLDDAVAALHVQLNAPYNQSLLDAFAWPRYVAVMSRLPLRRSSMPHGTSWLYNSVSVI